MSDYICQCGASFRSPSAEARHRHNFPAFCRKTGPGLLTRSMIEMLFRMRDNKPVFTQPSSSGTMDALIARGLACITSGHFLLTESGKVKIQEIESKT